MLSIAGWPCGSNSQPNSIITASPTMALTVVATAGLTALPSSSYPNGAPTAPPGTPAPQHLIPQQLQWSICATCQLIRKEGITFLFDLSKSGVMILCDDPVCKITKACEIDGQPCTCIYLYLFFSSKQIACHLVHHQNKRCNKTKTLHINRSYSFKKL